MRRACSILICSLMTAALAGCETPREASWQPGTEYTGAISPAIQTPGDVKYFSSDEQLRLGREYFARGAFGTAERYFRDAVEKAPQDRAAWIGLAASYDRIGRFDLADKAYHAALELGDETPQLLNNLGYSYMLRGDLAQARDKFEKAARLDSQNRIIQNNIALLDASYRYIQRAPDAMN